MIRVEHLNFTYNPKTPFQSTALSDITMEVKEGDFMGVVGHTGSGKSTLVSHFNALTRVQSGTLFVDGMDLSPKKIDFKKLRSTVGMVFQYPEYQLFDETVEKDVGFGPRNLGLDESEIASRVKGAIELVGLDYEKVKDRSPFDLSGGQMRRVALAGVIAMRPKVLILDEPTAGLDPKGKREILALIREIKKTCSAVIMISHNMDEVAENCNRIAVLSAGRLVGVFTPQTLFADKKLLEENKIELPSILLLADKLNEAGFEVCQNPQNETELISSLLSDLERRGLCAK